MISADVKANIKQRNKKIQWVHPTISTRNNLQSLNIM